jgi:hypothetical protein
LLPEDGFFRIQATSHEIQRNFQGVFPALIGIDQRRHGMIIGDEIIRLALFLKVDRGSHHSEVVSDVQPARRLNATKYSRLSHRQIKRKDRTKLITGVYRIEGMFKYNRPIKTTKP